MAEFKELVLALNDIRRGNFSFDAYMHNRSIFRKARPAILYFPVLVSDLVSIEDLTMITKALEREYCTVVRLAMGLDDIIDGDEIENKIDYIQKFHTNTYTSDDRDTFGELTADTEIHGVHDYFDRALNEDLKISNEDTVNYNKNELIAESLGLNLNNINSMTIKPILKEDAPSKDNHSPYKDQLLDNDVKKANELIPTTLDITVHQKCGEKVINQHILLGVKCVAHKVASEVMIENFINSITHNRKLFRFIQWTTGEIKFFKDYLLCLDILKKEALQARPRNQKGNNSRWFRTLKNKSLISKLKSALNLRDTLIPNNTFVMTMDEVDQIKNEYGIDFLHHTKEVHKIMDIFFSIGFVIVDSAAEIAYFMFDGYSTWQTFSFKALERENRNVANDVKAITSLMSRF